ncbi:ATP-binding protein [Mesorhizobium australicum]|uniref:ATP-binding protein n=1 Tax=Mesorhizobium australicum TaxID=536018 RepID=A0ACC6STZ0_9HYPH
MTFDEVMSGGEALLQKAILLEAQESLQLDFKGSASEKQNTLFTGEGNLTKDGRRAIAKALSAFSNSAGGVIVIGIECRKNPEGVDCAQSLYPVLNWRIALSAVSSSVSDLLQPKNDGIRVEGFASKGDPFAGYLVIDVPRSERRPHMCQMTRQYFKRSGSNSYSMEHFDVEDSFKRFSVPQLKLTHQFVLFSRSNESVDVDLELWLGNSASVSAQYPSLSLGRPQGVRFKYRGGDPAIRRINLANGGVSLRGGADALIHPMDGMKMEALRLTIGVSNRWEPTNISGILIDEATLVLPYRISALNMRPDDGILTLGPEDFRGIEGA